MPATRGAPKRYQAHWSVRRAEAARPPPPPRQGQHRSKRVVARPRKCRAPLTAVTGACRTGGTMEGNTMPRPHRVYCFYHRRCRRQLSPPPPPFALPRRPTWMSHSPTRSYYRPRGSAQEHPKCPPHGRPPMPVDCPVTAPPAGYHAYHACAAQSRQTRRPRRRASATIARRSAGTRAGSTSPVVRRAG